MIEDPVADPVRLVTPVEDSEAQGAIRVVVPYAAFMERRARRLRVALELKGDRGHTIDANADPSTPSPVALAASLPGSTVDGLR
jgi:hypothetical protein